MSIFGRPFRLTKPPWNFVPLPIFAWNATGVQKRVSVRPPGAPHSSHPVHGPTRSSNDFLTTTLMGTLPNPPPAPHVTNRSMLLSRHATTVWFTIKRKSRGPLTSIQILIRALLSERAANRPWYVALEFCRPRNGGWNGGRGCAVTGGGEEKKVSNVARVGRFSWLFMHAADGVLSKWSIDRRNVSELNKQSQNF